MTVTRFDNPTMESNNMTAELEVIIFIILLKGLIIAIGLGGFHFGLYLECFSGECRSNNNNNNNKQH